jgi:hypothetical protein
MDIAPKRRCTIEVSITVEVDQPTPFRTVDNERRISWLNRGRTEWMPQVIGIPTFKGGTVWLIRAI